MYMHAISKNGALEDYIYIQLLKRSASLILKNLLKEDKSFTSSKGDKKCMELVSNSTSIFYY